MAMSFRKRGIWISLISTLLIFGDYSLNILSLGGVSEEIAQSAALGLFLRALVLIIIVEIVFQGMLAISNRKGAELCSDERDKLFEYKANSLGYVMLVIGVFVTLRRVVFLELNPEFFAQSNTFNSLLLIAHILLFSFIFSEVVRFAAQLYYYRSGH